MRHTDLPHRINTLLQQKRANVKNWIRIRIIPIFSRSCNACGILLLILLFWPGINGFCQNSDSIKEIFEILARKDNSSIFGKLAKLHENGLFFGKESPEGIRQLLRYAEEQGNVNGIVLCRLMGNSARARVFKADYSQEEVDEAMIMARMSNNKYLLASAYWYYGRIQYYLEHFETMLVYFNASSQLVGELGLPKWKYMYDIDIEISRRLYDRYDYRNSVNYSLKCYRGVNDETFIINGYDKLHLLDMLGVGYMELAMPDSSIYYYDQLLNVLASESEEFKEKYQAIWSAIAEGRIGENLLGLGEISRANRLITKYYSESQRLGDSLNIMLSGNAYANLQYKLGNSTEALLLWKKNLNQSTIRGMEHLSERICHGIARIYQDQNNIDSMVHYLDQANELRRVIEQKVYRTSQETLQQQYEFMRLTSSVQNLNTSLTSMKNTRNLAILLILLFSGSIYMFQQKRTYKLKYVSEVEKARNERIQQELKASMDQLMTLKDNLNERNNLARTLIDRIHKLEQSKDASQLISEINDYILNSPEGWEKFKTTFLDIHPHFLHNLNERSPRLSPAEIR